jgi:hypothetical protein
MKKQSKPKWQLFAILSWLLTSCATVPPDVPACQHMASRLYQDPKSGHTIFAPSPTCMKQIGEAECGHCVYIMSGKEVFLGEQKGHWLNNKPWSTLRAQSVYLPSAESYAPLSTYIINSCKKMNCSDDVDEFKVKLDSLNGLPGALSNP